MERHDEGGYRDRKGDYKDGESGGDEEFSLEEVVQLGIGYAID